MPSMYASTSRADADFTNRQTCDPESANPTVALGEHAADELAEARRADVLISRRHPNRVLNSSMN